MAATTHTETDADDATPPRIDLAIFDAKCAERGATNDRARAALVGVDRTTVWRWRKGMAPTWAVASRIADQLGVTVDELTGRAA